MKHADPLDLLQARIALAVLDAQEALAEAVRNLARCHADATKRAGLEAARGAVARAAASVRYLGELAARVSVRFPRALAAAPEKFASFHVGADLLAGSGFSEAVSDVAFDEAVRALRERDPVGSADLAEIGASVADLYSGVVGTRGEVVYPAGFAAARAADRDTAKRVQAMLAEGLAGGTPTPKVVEKLVAAWEWPRSYAETVTRTSYGTATTDGRFREAARLERATGLRFGFRVSCVLDSDLRRGRAVDHGEDHRAMEGFTARQDDPVWRTHSPPYGYQCRCLLEVLVGDEVPERFVSPPAGASFAPGFGRRSAVG